MILGIGTDIVEIHRVEAALQRSRGRLSQRILAPPELAYFNSLAGWRQAEFLAGRFAAKEAISKALGIGLARLRPTEVALVQGQDGIQVQWLSAPSVGSHVTDAWHVSISHSTTSAVTFVVWERC